VEGRLVSSLFVSVLHSSKFNLGWRTPLPAIENNRETFRLYKCIPQYDIKKDLAESVKESGHFLGVYYLFARSLSG